MISDFVSRLDISALETQVQHTSEEISTLKNNFVHHLSEITQSVDSLTTKVDSQYHELSSTISTLTTTIDRQNAVIAKIQHDFKISMEILTKKLTHPFGSSNTATTNASTSFTRHLSPAG